MLPDVKMIGDMIAVRPDEISEERDSGLIVAKRVNELPTEGEVIAVGPGQWSLMGERMALQIKVGDRVTFEPLQVSKIARGEDQLYIMAEEQVLAILVDKTSKRTTPKKRAAKRRKS